MPTTATSTEWERVVNTTIRQYVKGEEDSVFRNRVLLALCKSKGQVLMNYAGDGIQWELRVKRAAMQVNNGAQSLMFNGVSRHVPMFLDYEGYAITDFVTKREKLKNRGMAQIINYYAKSIPLLMEDLQDQFSEELYIDSGAANNAGRMSGLETMMGINGTINVTSGAQRAANAADPTAYPSGTYAGQSTQLQTFGGSWNAQSDINTCWPYGYGDAAYDATSPTIVNYTSSAFGNTTWALNCVAAVRHLIWAMKRNKSTSLPLIMLNTGMYRDYLNKLDSKERVNIENSGLRKLGFGNSFQQDGAEITSEFGLPAAVGYGFDVDSIEILSMQDKLFEGEGPEWDSANRGWRTAVDCLGQIKFKSPRNFGKLAAIA